MPYKPRVAFAFVIGFVAICAPILASIYLAWRESVATEKTLGLTYAQDVLHRTEETASQFQAAQQKVAQARLPPCSPQDVKLLREVDLGSSFFKAAGRIANNTLLCTSQGVINPISLGEPDLVTEQGIAEYFNKQLWPQPGHALNVYASDGFAMIVDPQLAVDVSTEGPDVELAVFVPSAPDHDRVAAVGQKLPSNWFEAIPKGAPSTVLEDGYLVTRVRSAKWDISVVAATPQRYIIQRIRHFAFFFIPVGVLCGALLAWAVSYLTRVRSSFPTMLRRAVRDKAFYVEYQPVVELQSRRVIGAEALVRWSSRFADIRPDYFIPLAEDCGLIHLITKQVMEIVTGDLPRLLKMDPDFKVAINMSAADLRDFATIEALGEVLRTSGAGPNNVEVEATERAFLQGPETAELLEELRRRGFTISIDDFGTGYSSLSCLQSLALDTLKIDRAFVETINTDGATSQVVKHIIDMAHSLHLEMIAEGVENEPQARFLLNHGVRFAQGWHFGRPMPLHRLCEQIRIHAIPPEATFSASPGRRHSETRR